jgi:hypothetical protein
MFKSQEINEIERPNMGYRKKKTYDLNMVTVWVIRKS